MSFVGYILGICLAVCSVAAQTVMPPSVYKFDPAQQRVLNDKSPVVVVNFHRQKGKDYTASAMAVRDAFKTRKDWFIISLTQRQADATFAKCKNAAKALLEVLRRQGMQIEGDATEGDGFISEQYDKWIKQQFKFQARELVLPGGGRVVSLPGRDPDTLAGLTGNILLTEFGLFPGGGYEHWRTVFPLTTRGFQCVVISTPRGKNTKFYELWKNDDGENSVHTCSIWQSIEEGWSPDGPGGRLWAKDDVEALKRRYKDAAGWVREYECQFSGDAMSLVSWAEIERAAALPVPNDANGIPLTARYVRFDKKEFGDEEDAIQELVNWLRNERLALGWDIARKNDVSALAANVLNDGQPSHLALVVAMHDCEFAFMLRVVSALMDANPMNAGTGDRTGLGMESNETLSKKYGDRWVGHTFTSSGKRDVASAIRTAFKDGTQTLPPLDGPLKLIATDIYGLQCDETGARMVISETDNPLLDESHCDIAYGAGLARLSASRIFIPPLPVGGDERPEGM